MKFAGALSACLLIAPVPASLEAQTTPRRSDAVSLIVRPRVGDTLWLQLEQTVEMKGPMPAERQASLGAERSDRVPPARSPEYGPRRASMNTRVTRMHLFAHSVVEASDLTVTSILATTDSLLMWAGLSSEDGVPRAMPLPADGRYTRVKVKTDGTMMVNDPPPGSITLGTTLSSMPGMLPSGPVAVGAKWERDIPIPSLPIGGMRADGTLRATLRLDSLSRSARTAFISLSGTLRRDGASQDMPVGSRVISEGTIVGQLIIDRVRAWITDAHTVIDVRSEVSQGPGGGGVPLLLDIRVTQRMRVR